MVNCSGVGCNLIPKRYIVTFLAFLGYMLLLVLRSNLNIVIIAMTSNRTITVGDRNIVQEPEFNWNSKEQGFLLSAFPIGYTFVFLSGFVIQKVGGARMFGIGTGLASILSILSPFFLRISYSAYVSVRVAQGLLEGFAVVGTTDTFAHWAPPEERARLMTYCYTGAFVGIALSFQICGIIVDLFWWPAAFYITGAFSLLWSVVWLLYVSNDPSIDTFISEEEKKYYRNKMPNVSTEKVTSIFCTTVLPVPWKRIFTSLPVYILVNQFFTAAWVSSFLLYNLPLYVRDVYKVNIKDVGLLSSFPLWCAVIAHPIAGFIADYLRSNVFSVAKVHKIYFFFGELISGLLLLMAAYWGNFTVSIICFCLLRVAFSFADASYWVICIDMGGNFSGVLKSLCHTFLSLGNFLNPIFMGYMIPNHSVEEWNFYFFVLSMIAVYGVVTFLIFGSAELQPWAIPAKPEAESGNKSDEKTEQVSAL